MSRQYFFCRRLKYVPTEHDTFSTGEAFDRFPLDKVGDEAECMLRFAGAPAGSARTFRFKLKNMAETDKSLVTINDCALAPDRTVRQSIQSDNGNSFAATIWEASVSMPPLRLGVNTIRVRLEGSAHDRQGPIEIGEFEILVTPDGTAP